ncbi:hypothetical protein [Streptomyces sp. NPDC048644]|uniref:hypothetical protein n=1 Tax=Streptomyces sp. NPDC048644 TaxID=3365582 RepID=UPI003721F532
MTVSNRCDCGSDWNLRDVYIDTASGPCIARTYCGDCAPGPSRLDTVPGSADPLLPTSPQTPRHVTPEA